jgi:hypothetical protein
VLRPSFGIVENSAFPFQVAGGPAWNGRGTTAQAQAGVAAAWKGFHLQLAPLVFVVQNAAFTLANNGRTGLLRFADARFPANIDAPQRFGDKPFGRLEAGTSTGVFDGFGVVAGFTTAPQRWGPAREYPLVLGPNAGGFPTVFFGTSTPLDLWLLQLNGRLTYSRLEQSEFALPVRGQRARLGTGGILSMSLRGLPGLEAGISRFIHNPWPEEFHFGQILRHPLTGGFNLLSRSQNLAEENQVASIFARWVVPAARVEVYAEMYREDYPGRFHAEQSVIEKPDDLASFTIGLQRVMSVGTSRMRVIRAELVNGETSHQERDERGFSSPLPPYIHSTVTQGHSVNGLLLGSPEAYGGAAWRLGYDELIPSGRRTVSIERSLRVDWLPTLASPKGISPDVLYALRLERLYFRRGMEYGLTLIPALDFNRNLVTGHDAFNLTAAATVRGWP